MQICDTHIHLYAEEFDIDRDELISKAIDLGVTKFFLPNIDSTSIRGMLDLEEKYPGVCFPMMGLHPCYVKENYLAELAIVDEWFQKRKFVAVGEIGIDLYWDKAFFNEQKIAFVKQVELANHHNLPIIIHTRNSFDETYDLLLANRKNAPQGIFHCFSGTLEQAQKVIDLGFLIGIGGVATFKNGGMDKVLPHISLDHIVLETDAPYLAPVPYRGRRNEPSYILKVTERVSELKNISVAEVGNQTTKNALQLFGINA